MSNTKTVVKNVSKETAVKIADKAIDPIAETTKAFRLLDTKLKTISVLYSEAIAIAGKDNNLVPATSKARYIFLQGKLNGTRKKTADIFACILRNIEKEKAKQLNAIKALARLKAKQEKDKANYIKAVKKAEEAKKALDILDAKKPVEVK